MEINKVEYEIGVYDLEGHFIDSSDSWEYLENKFKITRKHTHDYINANSNRFDIYQLRLKRLDITSSRLPYEIGNCSETYTSGQDKQPVAKYYNDKLICVYNTVVEASNLTGIKQGSISSAVIRNNKIKGFNFKYIE